MFGSEILCSLNDKYYVRQYVRVRNVSPQWHHRNHNWEECSVTQVLSIT